MQVSIGTSSKSDVESAVTEVTVKVGSNPNLLILLSSYEHLEEASQKISRMYPNTPLIGTSATSYFGSEASDQRMLLISFGQDAEAQVGVIRDLSSAPLRDIADMESKVANIRAGKEDTVCIEFCTNDEERLVTSMNVALEHADIPLLGGTIFGIPEGQKSYAMMNGILYADACCYALIKNKSGKIRTYSELIFKPMEGVDQHIATSVNLEKKELITLDGKPAAAVYCEDAGVSQSELVEHILTNPLGRVIGDEIFIASPYEIGKNGSLINYKRLNENDAIRVMELMDYEEIGRDTRNEIKSDNNKISFIFSVNCIYRHLLYTQRGYLREYLGDMSKVGPYVGIVGGGEQYKKQHINQTMVCAVFE